MLIALLLLGLGTLAVLPGNYANRLAWIAAIAIGVLAAAIVIAVSTGDLFASMFAKLPDPVGPVLAHIVRELVGALRAYLAQPLLLAVAIVISVAQYRLVLAALGVLGRAMRFEGLSWSAYVIAGAWSLVANSLPVTPAASVSARPLAHVASILTTIPRRTQVSNRVSAMRS